MHNLSLRRKLMEFSRNTVIKTGSDGKQKVTVAHRHIGSVSSVHAQIPHKERMICGNGSPAHDSRHHRHFHLFHNFRKNLICPCDAQTASCQKQWPLRLLEHFQCLLKLSNMDTGIGLVSTDIHSLWILCASQLTHHILGKIYQNRPRPSRTGDIKSFFDDPSQIFSFSHCNSIFCDTSGDSHDIHFLKCVIANQVSGHLAGETYDGNTVVIGSGKASHHIGRSGSAGHQADSHFSRGSGIGICLMNQCLFMTGKNNVDTSVFSQLITDINSGRPRVAKENFHAFFFQSFHKQFVTCNLFHCQ